MYDVIVIGAGPAGLTASIYISRAGKKVLVLDAVGYGGAIINTLDIENYPATPHISGFDYATALYNQAKELGAEILFEKVIDIKVEKNKKEVITEKNKYEGNAIIIATGSTNNRLNLKGEDELIGKGISYCATCDGAFYKNKTVAVVGGGDTALDDALYLTDIAKKVYLIHRRDEFRGANVTLNNLKKKKNIEFIYNSNITKLNKKDKLESIEITDNKENKKTLKIDGLFITVGRTPETENFKRLVKTDDDGYIIAGEDCKTNIDGIFVSGDNRTKTLRQLTTATSDGANAATNAIEYINKLK